jgi:hypothetical protein
MKNVQIVAFKKRSSPAMSSFTTGKGRGHFDDKLVHAGVATHYDFDASDGWCAALQSKSGCQMILEV